MRYRVEDLINKCVEGRAARDIVKSIEEELPDASDVRMHLLKDLNRLGVRIPPSDVQAEDACIKVSIDKSLMENRGAEVMGIAETYSRTYPEVEVLVATKS